MTCAPWQQIFLGPGSETTRLQRRRFRFRDVAVEHSAEPAIARTTDEGTGRHSAILRGYSFAILWRGASAAPGIRARNSAAKAHSRVDSRAIVLSYFVGVILILAGVCLLVNKKTRMAATFLGLTILLTVLWIYLPMLLAAPTDVVALNFFFDTLLFSGTILLLANALDKETAVART